MGMSASQARLLSLQARMSDVEYEGQQINQQRLVLSNKMNEVMEKMTNMDVPTPPSKQDFLYNKYSGKTKNGKKISAEMNDNGNFDVKKDVSGRIVQDAGLQNITSGSQMKGSEISIPTKTADGYHVCEGNEEPMTNISSEATTGAYPFNKYETNDFREYFSDKNPKLINQTTPYTGTSVNGYENKCYANDSASTYISVPNLEYVEDTPVGYYKNGKYYGTDSSSFNQQVYCYNGVEYSSKEELKEATKTERNGKTTYLSESVLNGAKRYKNVPLNIQTGAPGSPEYTSTAINPTYVFSNGHYESTGSYTDIKLDFPLENDKYKEILKQCQDQFAALLKGASSMNVNGTDVPVSGRPSESGICSRDIAAVTGITPQNVNIGEIDTLYTYTEFIGVDKDSVGGFQSGSEYVRTNPNAKIGSGAGVLKTGAEIIEHNDEVDQNMGITFYYETSEGKFVSCSGSKAKSLAESGTKLYAETEGGGRGISNQEPDFSCVKENYYIVDDDNSAQLISANGGIDWAIAQIKAGKKLFSKGTGDMIAYDKALENDVTVNGCQTMPVTQADGMDIYHNNTAFQDALSGLKQSFPEGQNASASNKAPHSWKDFSVIIDNSGTTQSYRFCLTEDLTSTDGQVRVYTPGVGTYQEKIENVEPTYDNNGYLEKLILPNGEVVDMEVEQAVDEVEYDKAMNKYNIAKIEYDKEVNELNKQTSIYQRQDKTLELKLTRLDTERNALNTEIDAVKKVIQDATEKGFKTFSG